MTQLVKEAADTGHHLVTGDAPLMPSLTVSDECVAASIGFYVRTHPVRVAVVNGLRWFVATDVVRAVGYSNIRSLSSHVPVRHQGVATLRLPEGELTMRVFAEAGLTLALARRKRPVVTDFKAKMAALSRASGYS